MCGQSVAEGLGEVNRNLFDTIGRQGVLLCRLFCARRHSTLDAESVSFRTVMRNPVNTRVGLYSGDFVRACPGILGISIETIYISLWEE